MLEWLRKRLRHSSESGGVSPEPNPTRRLRVESPSHTKSSLVEGVKLQQPEAWVRLVHLCGPMVYGWCRRAGLREQDAADVVQETFRSVATGIARFHRQTQRRGAFRAWLWSVTRSKLQDHHRRLARHPVAIGGSEAHDEFEAIPKPWSDRSDTLSIASDSSLIMRAAELVRPEFSETTWQAFWHIAVDDKPTDVVAKQLGISVAAVRQANYRVRRRLRAELEGIL